MRIIEEKALTGDEAWQYRANTDTRWVSAYVGKLSTPAMPKNSLLTPMCCTHAPYRVYSNENYLKRTELGFMGYRDTSAAFIMTIPNCWNNVNGWKDFLREQHEAGTPLTVWYERDEPAIERVYLGALRTIPHYTYLEAQGNLLPDITATVKVADEN